MDEKTSDPNLSFYESLASSYHLLYEDWPAAIGRQGEVLDKLFRSELGDRTLIIRDYACGIGTQALGLARKGHQVWASDLSPAAVARAREEARKEGLEISFQVADMRDPSAEPAGFWEVILVCDNALPHLLSTEDVGLAASNFFERLRPGGLVLISTRDYDHLLRTRPSATPLKIMGSPNPTRVTFQLWDWLPNDDVYLLQQFIIQQSVQGWKTSVFQARYRAWRRSALTEIFREAGFSSLRWTFPEETQFYQPIMIGRVQN